MSDINHRNQAFDYAPPKRGGSGYGALLLVGGVVALFILGMVLLSVETVPPESAAPAGAVAPAESGAPAIGTTAIEPLGLPAPTE